MRTIILTYLLLKCAFERTVTMLDISMARVVRDTYPLEFDVKKNRVIATGAPTWLRMIANMTAEDKLPEAFTDFRMTIVEDIKARVAGWFE